MIGGPSSGPRGARISILHFSGAGGTKLVAELLGEILSTCGELSVTGIEDSRAMERASEADLLVFCYPTYYLRPAPSMREFVEALGSFEPPRVAYVVTTCELYSENSVRRLALMLKKHGILVAGSKVVRAPGSDATCVFPNELVPWLYRFERGFPEKLRAIAQEILAIAEGPEARGSIPRLKWYTPFTQLLQILVLNRFDAWRGRMRVLQDRCTLCGACVMCCDRKAWEMGEKGPVNISGRCELCTRCIHRCPSKAIVLLKGLKDNRRLDSRLFAQLRADARERLGLGKEENTP
jgi:NAD-dependent dihydropyrimidine dehydrogenase PreA subunit